MFKGLLVTASHFFRSYGKRNLHVPGKELFPGGRFGLFTVQYPEEDAPIPSHYRGLPILLYDDESRAELCTACMNCVRACPIGIIHIEQALNEEGKKLPYATSYTIEHGACMNCGLCSAACSFGALVLDHNLETAQTSRPIFLRTKEQLLHPISYYQEMSPDGWAEISESALKSLPRTIKRRPKGMGIVSR